MKSSFILAAIYGIVNAAGDPLPDWEITPGPGMPSLEAVGLSKEKLHKMSLEEMANPGTHVKARAISRIERSPLVGRQDIERYCLPEHPAEESCALACILYLHSLGNTPCVASEGLPDWCVCRRPGTNGAAILGFSRPSVSYSCRDIANTMSWVPNNADCHYKGTCGKYDHCVGGFIVIDGVLLKLRKNLNEHGGPCIEGQNYVHRCVL
jgi:hypothetical protein